MPQRSASERLLNAVDDFHRICVVTHDFPDPDAIAAGWALQRLFSKRSDKPCRLIGGGAVVRSENRELLRLLAPPLELVKDWAPREGTATVLVDCNAAARNHLLARVPTVPTAAIDHHRAKAGVRRPEALVFSDQRPHVAATVSIAASYLREQEVEPGSALASAMLYAIRTETQGYETRFSRLDRDMLGWITERADPSKVAEIQNSPLPRSHFGDLVLALQGTFLYDATAVCILPRAAGPETVAEVADLLVRAEGVDAVLCAGRVGSAAMVSIRTGPEGRDAAELARGTLSEIGESGGHGHRAGGKVSDVAGDDGTLPMSLRRTLRDRFLEATGCERQRGTRLIAKASIVDNL